MATQPRTLTAKNQGQHLFEYDFPALKDQTPEGREKWEKAGGERRMVRLGSEYDNEQRQLAPKRMTKDERDELDRLHPPRSVKVSGEEWDALWASQKATLQAAAKAGDIQVTTGDIDLLEG